MARFGVLIPSPSRRSRVSPLRSPGRPQRRSRSGPPRSRRSDPRRSRRRMSSSAEGSGGPALRHPGGPGPDAGVVDREQTVSDPCLGITYDRASGRVIVAAADPGGDAAQDRGAPQGREVGQRHRQGAQDRLRHGLKLREGAGWSRDRLIPHRCGPALERAGGNRWRATRSGRLGARTSTSGPTTAPELPPRRCRMARAARLGVGTPFIAPCSPWENGYREVFNGKLR